MPTITAPYALAEALADLPLHGEPMHQALYMIDQLTNEARVAATTPETPTHTLHLAPIIARANDLVRGHAR